MFAVGLCFFVAAWLIDVAEQGAQPDGLRSSWPVVLLGVGGMALMLASLVLIAWRVLP